jgi:hypothetical protein
MLLYKSLLVPKERLDQGNKHNKNNMVETIISNTKLNTKVFQPSLMAAFRPIAEMNLLQSWTRRTTLSTHFGSSVRPIPTTSGTEKATNYFAISQWLR